MKIFLAHRPFLATLLMLPLALHAGRAGTAGQVDSFAVVNPKTLAADKVQCERVALGEPDDYKPCIARLPSGELLP